MRRMRFSIRSLVGFILICGVAFAALKQSTDWWEKGTFSMTVLVLLTAVLLGVHLAGGRRAFWLGFGLFGWGYLGLSLVPAVETRLVTSQGLAYLFAKLPGRMPQLFTVTYTGFIPTGPFPSFTTSTAGVASQPNLTYTLSNAYTLSNSVTDPWSAGQIPVLNVSGGGVLQFSGGTQENFVKIGHTVIAVLLAWTGGMMSRWILRSRASIENSFQTGGSEP